MTNQDDIKKYIDDIIEISKLSNKDTYIIYDFLIKEDRINSTISSYNQNGDKKVLRRENINIENKFFNFFTPLIEEFSKFNNVVHENISDTDSDNLVTYRLITDNNDQMSIDGLTFQDVSVVNDIVSNSKKHNKPKTLTLSNTGKIDFYVVIIVFVIFLILLATIIYFI